MAGDVLKGQVIRLIQGRVSRAMQKEEADLEGCFEREGCLRPLREPAAQRASRARPAASPPAGDSVREAEGAPIPIGDGGLRG